MAYYGPVYGKTYSLFGQDTLTESFYRRIAAVTDEILARLSMPDARALEKIQWLSRQKIKLKNTAGKATGHSSLAAILQLMDDKLAEYLPGLAQHIRDVPVYKIITDKELLCSREQYYLFMIEFELVNRVHRRRFQDANYRLALLPYCLKETQTACKAKPDETDFQCRGCLKTCYINQVSRVLRDHQVSPYIWSRGSLRTLFGKLVRQHGSLGVLGIACIVELIRGMRYCMKAGLPVLGIPLNANRCPRWMGRMYETSVDVAALERLVADKQNDQ